jgi:hypothetical protein
LSPKPRTKPHGEHQILISLLFVKLTIIYAKYFSGFSAGVRDDELLHRNINSKLKITNLK